MSQEVNSLGEGNLYSTEFRMFDPRLGRWMSLDPLMDQFPWMSPFAGMDNNPISLSDPLGLKAVGGEDPIFDNGKIQPEVYVFGKMPEHLKKSNKNNFFKNLLNKAKANFHAILKSALLFKLGFANAFASNQILGVGRGNPENFGKYSGIVQAGQTAGDLASVVTGTIEVIDGGTAGTAGVALSSTGVGSIVGVPVTAGGVVVATHGSTVIGTATSNIIQDGINADKGGGSSGVGIEKGKGKDTKKMTSDEIGEFLNGGKNWHKSSLKKDFLKQFKKELKGDTNADFYVDKNTKEVFLKSNKSGNWIKTGQKIK